MDINSNFNLEYKNIRNSLSRLTSRQLFILVYRMYLDNIDIVVINNLEYLINKIQTLGWTASVLNEYIEYCINMVIDDEYTAWLEKNIRAAIWFDKYWSQYKNDKTMEEATIYADFKKGFLRSFDSNYLINQEQSNPSLSRNNYNQLSVSNIISAPFPQWLNSESIIVSMYVPFNNIEKTKMAKSQSRLKIMFITLARRRYDFLSANIKDLKWIDDRNVEQIDWATNHLDSQGLLLKPDNFILSGSKDYYDQICASIDAFEILKNELGLDDKRRELSQKQFIEKMRNAWYQKKSRDKTPPKSLSKSLLTPTYKRKLKILSDKYDMEPSTYLERLIDRELKNVGLADTSKLC